MIGAGTGYFASASGTTYNSDVTIGDLGKLYNYGIVTSLRRTSRQYGLKCNNKVGNLSGAFEHSTLFAIDFSRLIKMKIEKKQRDFSVTGIVLPLLRLLVN